MLIQVSASLIQVVELFLFWKDDSFFSNPKLSSESTDGLLKANTMLIRT